MKGIALDKLTQALLRSAEEVARETSASAVVIVSQYLRSEDVQDMFGHRKLIFVKRSTHEGRQDDGSAVYLSIPDVPLTRMSQVKIAAFMALCHEAVSEGDTVVFLSGLPESGVLDTLVVSRIGSESELFAYFPKKGTFSKDVNLHVIERVVHIAMQLSNEGREGRPLGALFVIGDTKNVLSFASQTVLNPFEGHAENKRHVLSRLVKETIKEFASIDGAFIINGEGVIESCGTYLGVEQNKELLSGLGTRHVVAAGITSCTESVAITVSQSTGTVTVFHSGHVVSEIDRPLTCAECRKSPNR